MGRLNHNKTLHYHEKQKIICNGNPYTVWQQPMEKAKNIRYKKQHVGHKTLCQYQIDFTQYFDSKSIPLPQTEASEENLIDHEYGLTHIGRITYTIKIIRNIAISLRNQQSKFRTMTSLMTRTCQKRFDTR